MGHRPWLDTAPTYETPAQLQSLDLTFDEWEKTLSKLEGSFCPIEKMRAVELSEDAFSELESNSLFTYDPGSAAEAQWQKELYQYYSKHAEELLSQHVEILERIEDEFILEPLNALINEIINLVTSDEALVSVA